MAVMTRRRSVAFALVAAALAAVGCSGTNAVSQSVSGSLGYGSGDQATTWIASDHRSAVTGVTGTLLDGSSFDLAQWRGRVVVVNFWDSWCKPYEAEAQSLEQVYRDDRDKGVEFLGVDVRDNSPQADAFIQRHHISYPNLFDESNVTALRFQGLPPNATPTTIVLDRQGRIAARHSGAILYSQLRDLVARALREHA
jgi:thiol-disulfide isomerase/thioredoxin